MQGATQATRLRPVTATLFFSDGDAVTLEEGQVRTEDGPILNERLPDHFADAGAWIEYDDTAVRASAREWEDDEEEPCVIRRYARGVIGVMLVREQGGS